MCINYFTLKYFLQESETEGWSPRNPPFLFCEGNDGPGQIREGFGGYAIKKWDVNSYNSELCSLFFLLQMGYFYTDTLSEQCHLKYSW